jgi:acetyl-CoA carboxylase, biotin carboxylase subunit
MTAPFRKLLVANRGEIALRIVRACKELETPTVAVYSEPDRDALHVRLADEAVCIGPAQAARSYLNIGAMLDAARRTGADAIHPGYGFLSENPRFAAACFEAGITFVGPAPETMERLGDKVLARQAAMEVGVPVVPGSDGPVADEAEALAVAQRIGFPVMVKAAAGGGGRGIRTVRGPAELEHAVHVARQEAHAAFADEAVYLERLLEEPRHVEVQILGDGRTAIHLGERECSMQRRRQKVLEEGPSPLLTPDLRQAITDAAVRIARAVRYAGAGTVEFLVDREGRFYFIEVNSRIQVEHPVTEMLTGVDLLQEQIRIAGGEPLRLRQEDVAPRGWAMEFRINAEDPDRGFFPSPGTITALEVPGGAGVRVDSAVHTGYRVLPFYDSLIAKLVVWAPTRAEVVRRARRALDEYRIEGIRTTIPLHKALLRDPQFAAGQYHTEYLEQWLAAREKEGEHGHQESATGTL